MTDDARRQVLLDQLGYLAVEAEALGPLLAEVPPEVLTLRPLPDQRSGIETFVLLAALDRQVRSPRLAQIVAEDEPAFEPVDEDALLPNEPPVLAEALAEVREAREQLIAAFSKLSAAEWARTARWPEGETLDVYEWARRIVQRDAAELRTLTYRLHESQISTRPPPGPSAPGSGAG